MLSLNTPRAALACLGLVLGLTLPASAHEFWVEPKAFRLEPGAAIVADLKVGQNFRGDTYPYLKSQFISFRITDRAGSRDRHAVGADRGPEPLCGSRPF